MSAGLPFAVASVRGLAGVLVVASYFRHLDHAHG